MKLFGYERIALGDLACGKTKRNAGLLSMILNEKHQAVQTAMYRPAMIVSRTEIVDCRRLDKASGMQSVFNELFNALTPARRNRHNRNSQHRFHFIDANGTAVGSHLIHHVQGQNHGTAEFHELQREIHVALDVGGVDDVDDDVGVFAKDKLARDDFFVGVRRKRVDAGQIGYERFFMADNSSVFSVNRNAGKIADVLVRPGQFVKKRCLAAVLIANERDPNGLGRHQRLLTLDHLIFTGFCVAGVIHFYRLGVRLFCRLPFADILHKNLIGFGYAQSKFITADSDLNGISHRCSLDQGYRGLRDQPHVQKMLAKRASATDHFYGSGLADVKLIECDSHSY